MTNLRTYISWYIRLDSKQNRRSDGDATHIVFLAETKESLNLGSTLGTEALRVDGVGDAGERRVTLLDDAEGEDGQVHADDATANRLPLALTSAARTVAAVAVAEKQTHTSRVHNTLLHRKTLLVVASSDLEDVSLELIAETVAGDLLAHTPINEAIYR